MLSASEIVELEKKVFAYRLRSVLRYILFIFLLLLFSLISFLAYTYMYKTGAFTTKIVDDNSTVVLPPIELKEVNNSLSLPLVSPPIAPEEKQNVLVQPPIPLEENQTLILRSPSVNTGNETKKIISPIQAPRTESIKQDFSHKESSQESSVLLPPMLKEEPIHRITEESLDTDVLAPPRLEEIKPKGFIKIESKEVNSIEYLKDKFEKTSNIIFALMLAEEYYANKNYTESNKWALIANHIDAENEKSWLWFAKSKVKLGQKEDAIVALKAFLKKNKSQAAQTLLNKISLGEFNE